MTSRVARPPISLVAIARGAKMALHSLSLLERWRFHPFQHQWSTINS